MSRSSRRSPLRSLGIVALTLAVLVGCLNLPDGDAKHIGPRAREASRVAVDEHLELARRYAPWIYHETHPQGGRQDLPTRVDFDGNLRGDDNWESFARFELAPTVYYAALETSTHWFLTYHLFHPRDWAPVRLGLNDTHENDGENLQVVVDKGRAEPVLLFTQAHYRGRAYARREDGFGDAEVDLEGDFLRVDDAGRPARDGLHACVFVESCGHGIFGVPDRDADVEVDAAGRAKFDRAGFVLRAARAGDAILEPDPAAREPVPYQLASTAVALWPGVRDRALIGSGGLFDGCVDYEDARVRVGVPRYYEADRFSGPLGSDRGIAPFAVDFGFCAGEVGALFFDPARRYRQFLRLPEPWSLEYVAYPFATR